MAPDLIIIFYEDGLRMVTNIKENTRTLLVLPCHCCGLVFFLCSHCYSGHKYCCNECRTAARRKSARKAQRKYRQTAEGKKAHSEAEKRRRMGRSKEKKKTGIFTEILVKCCTVAVMFALYIVNAGNRTGESRHCHFCDCPGVTVNKFSRAYVRKTLQEAG